MKLIVLLSFGFAFALAAPIISQPSAKDKRSKGINLVDSNTARAAEARQTPAEDPTMGGGGVVVPYGRRQTPAEDPSMGDGSGVVVPYGRRQTPDETPTMSGGGEIVPYGRRQNDVPVSFPGGLLPHGP